MVITYNDSILNNVVMNILRPAWHDDTTISSHAVYIVCEEQVLGLSKEGLTC